MLVKSPRTLHYPITVTKLYAKSQEKIKRSERLFSYKFPNRRTYVLANGDEEEETVLSIADFRAENDGKVLRWKIEELEVIDGPG
jgi:RNA polymerase II subunit A-like phosphatase